MRLSHLLVSIMTLAFPLSSFAVEPGAFLLAIVPPLTPEPEQAPEEICELTLRATAPDAAHTLSIVEVFLAEGELHVVGRLERDPDLMAAQVLTPLSSTVNVAGEFSDAKVHYYLLEPVPVTAKNLTRVESLGALREGLERPEKVPFLRQ